MSTINDKLIRLASYKDDIKAAIIAKGQTVGDNMSLYAEAISKISGGGGDIPEILDTDPLTFVRVDNSGIPGSIALTDVGAVSTKTFQYNKNDEGWLTYTANELIPMNYGDKIQFKSTSTTPVSIATTAYRKFKTIGSYKCGGDITSLIDNSDTLTSYAFIRLFEYCNIYSAPALPATTLAMACYQNMFLNCISLVNAPTLPATTLANFCYAFMFNNCISLVNAPALPATTLAQTCYQLMFYNCTSLVNAPALPATTLTSNCYQLMFYGCSSIKTIYCNARYSSGTTEITNSIGSSWLYGVPNTSECTFYKNPDWSGPTTRSNNTIPSNWLIVNWIQ